MVSIFGGYPRGPRGPAGPTGPRGKDGQDGLQLMSQWFPNTILRIIQEYSEKGCFLLEDTDVDLRINDNDEIVKWVDHALSDDNGLWAVDPSKDVKKILDKKYTRYAIGFQNNSYLSDQILLDTNPGTGFICFTFKTNSKTPSYLLSNYIPDDKYFSNFEILVDMKTICVQGYSSQKIYEYGIATNAKDWTTLFLEYTVKDKEIHFHYMLDADKDQIGEFSLSAPISTKGGYTLGQRHAVPTKNSFSGDIACLEFYHNPSQERFPLDLCMVISKNQKVELMPESQSLENGAKRKRVESGEE